MSRSKTSRRNTASGQIFLNSELYSNNGPVSGLRYRAFLKKGKKRTLTKPEVVAQVDQQAVGQGMEKPVRVSDRRKILAELGSLLHAKH